MLATGALLALESAGLIPPAADVTVEIFAACRLSANRSPLERWWYGSRSGSTLSGLLLAELREEELRDRERDKRGFPGEPLGIVPRAAYSTGASTDHLQGVNERTPLWREGGMGRRPRDRRARSVFEGGAASAYSATMPGSRYTGVHACAGEICLGAHTALLFMLIGACLTPEVSETPRAANPVTVRYKYQARCVELVTSDVTTCNEPLTCNNLSQAMCC